MSNILDGYCHTTHTYHTYTTNVSHIHDCDLRCLYNQVTHIITNNTTHIHITVSITLGPFRFTVRLFTQITVKIRDGRFWVCYNMTTHIIHTTHTYTQLITTHIMNTAQSECWFMKKSTFSVLVTYGSTTDTSLLICSLCPFKIQNEWLASLELIFYCLICVVCE